MAYRDIILATSGLVSYWALDEASGTTASDQGDSNPGTYNAVTLNQAAPSGLTKSASFNGSSSYVAVSNNSNLSPSGTALTVEAWIKTSTSSVGTILSHWNTASPFAGYGMDINADSAHTGQLSVWVGSGSWTYGGPNLADGNWHHAVMTISGTTVSLYVDGSQVATSTQTSSLAGTNALNIGRSAQTGTQFFNGSIAGVAVYNTALSLSDIQSHYNAGNVATSFTLTGPTKGYVSVQSQPFVVKPNGGYTGTITLSDGGAGGTFSPSASISYTGGSSASNVYYTPSAAGTVTISASASPSLTAPSSLSLAVNASPGGYAATVLSTQGLSHYWRLEEASGTSAADAQGSATGTYTGGYTLGVSGVVGNGVTLNGSTGYVNVGTVSDLPTTGNYTLEAWFKVQPGTTMGSNGIVGYGNYGTNNAVNALRFNGNNQVYNYWWSSDALWTLPIDVRDGVWHHIAVTFDGAKRTLYFDGAAVGSPFSATGFNATTASLTIGTTGTSHSEYLPGTIDEVAIYNVALSQSTIQSHYGTGIPATSFTLTGPTKGYAGVQTSQPFVVQPNGGYTGTITLSDGGAGGTFSPSASVTYTGGVSASNVYYTPAATGTVTISASASPSLTAPSSLSLAAGAYPGNYAATVLTTTGLSYYWQLGETSGTAAADSADSNAGTYTGTYTLAAAGPSTMKALSVSGAGYVATTVTPANGFANVSLEAWVYLTANPGSNAIVAGFRDDGGSTDKNIYIDSSGRPNWYVYDGAAKTITGTSLPLNSWHHVVGTADGTTAKLYIDGVLAASTACGNTYAAYGSGTTGTLRIAGNQLIYANLSGRISNVSAYNVALSQSTILSHYNATGANPAGRASQAGTAAIAGGTPKGRASHGGMAAVVTGSGRGRASHGGVTAAAQGSPRGRASHGGILAVVQQPQGSTGSATLATRTQFYATNTTPTTFAPDNVSQVLIVAATQGSPSASLSQSLLVAIASPSPMGTVSQIGALVVETTSPVANVSQASALVVYQMIFVGNAALSRSATLASTGTMPYYGNASLSTRKSISSTGTMPWYGTATLSTGKSFSSSGTHSPPLYIGTCSVSTRHTAAIAGTFTPLVYAGNASVQIAVSSSSSGTFTLPVYIGLATLVTSRAISSAGTHTPPTYEGSCVVAVHPTIAATGVAISAYIGDASLSARCVFTSTGVFVPPVYVGVCVVSRHPTFSGTGTATTPTYIGTASLSRRAIFGAAGNLFSPSYVGNATLVVRHTIVAAGTFTIPVYVGNATLVVRHTIVASGTFTIPVYVGNATIVVRHTIVAAGTFTIPVYAGRATLVVRHTIVASGTFTTPTYAGVAVLSTRTTLVSAGISLPPIYGGTLDVLIIDVGIVSGGVSEVPVYSGNADLTVLVEETVITGTNTYKIGKYFIIAWVIRNNHE